MSVFYLFLKVFFSNLFQGKIIQNQNVRLLSSFVAQAHTGFFSNLFQGQIIQIQNIRETQILFQLHVRSEFSSNTEEFQANNKNKKSHQNVEFF